MEYHSLGYVPFTDLCILGVVTKIPCRQNLPHSHYKQVSLLFSGGASIFYLSYLKVFKVPYEKAHIFSGHCLWPMSSSCQQYLIRNTSTLWCIILFFAPVHETQKSCISKYRPEEFRARENGRMMEKVCVISSAYISRIFWNDYLPNCAPQAIGKSSSVLCGQ